MPTMEELLMVMGLPSPLASVVTSQSPAVAWAAIAVVVAVVGLHLLRVRRTKAELGQRRDRKRRQCEQARQDLANRLKNSSVSVEQQAEILALPLVKLRDRLRSGTLKAVDVLQTYQIKALAENEQLNAVTEPIRDAQEVAEECDRKSPRPDQLLYGVPVSIKESIGMAGYDSTAGLARWVDRTFTEDAVLVQVLKQHGAIPFVKTNLPQALISWCTCNPIYGQTLNPHHPEMSPGGSTGGEGALLAAGGSPLGLGGDIGGSIRIPSNCCGVYGIKPTAGRVSSKGMHPAAKALTLIQSVHGPMARDVDGLALGFRVLVSLNQHVLDRTVAPAPFRDELYESRDKLRIGYYVHDDYIHAVPAMQRAVTVATATLKRLGHEVVEWNFPELGKRGFNLWGKTIFADGGKGLLENVKEDETDHAIELLIGSLGRNSFLKAVLAFLLKLRYPRLGEHVANTRGISSMSGWNTNVRDVLAFREEVEASWRKKGLDAVICPGLAVTAPPVGTHRWAIGAPSYTCTYNTLNFPVGSMPVTKVTTEDIDKMRSYPTPDPWHKAIKEMVDGRSEGLPCNVQVITLPWEEEKCLSVMKQLEEALQSETPTM